jgi:hypothetical protein
MTIYEELIERVSNGETFHIDFEKRTMKIGKNYLVKDGEYDVSRKLINAPGGNISIIEKLYQEYRISFPSKRSDNKRRKYFKALPIEELSIDDMINGQSREVTQCKLEGYILCSVLNGSLKWDKDVMGYGWFWQSENNKDLIILKKWIELDNTKLI